MPGSVGKPPGRDGSTQPERARELAKRTDAPNNFTFFINFLLSLSLKVVVIIIIQIIDVKFILLYPK